MSVKLPGKFPGIARTFVFFFFFWVLFSVSVKLPGPFFVCLFVFFFFGFCFLCQLNCPDLCFVCLFVFFFFFLDVFASFFIFFLLDLFFGKI